MKPLITLALISSLVLALLLMQIHDLQNDNATLQASLRRMGHANKEQSAALTTLQRQLMAERALFNQRTEEKSARIRALDESLKALQEGKATDDTHWSDVRVPGHVMRVLKQSRISS